MLCHFSSSQAAHVVLSLVYLLQILTAPHSESRVATAVNARNPQSFHGLLNWHGECRCEDAAVCPSAFGHFWPFLAGIVMLAGDIPWHVTVCSNSSQPGSLMWLEGKQESVNLQEQTVLSCHYQHFMPLQVDKTTWRKAKGKILRSVDLWISFSVNSWVSWLDELELDLKPRHTGLSGYKPHHSSARQLLGSVDTEVLSTGQAPYRCQLPSYSACYEGVQRNEYTRRRSQGNELELAPAVNNQLFWSPWSVGCNETEKKSDLWL